MEPFAIWNLLKTVLNAPEPPAANAKNNDCQTTNFSREQPTAQAEQGTEHTPEHLDNSPSQKLRANACEEYFLRHEQLKNQRKR